MLICTRDLTALHSPFTFIHSFAFLIRYLLSSYHGTELFYLRKEKGQERVRTEINTAVSAMKKNHSCLVYFPDSYYNHPTDFPDR